MLLPEEFKPGEGTFQVPFDGQTIVWVLTTFDVSQKSSSTSDASSGSNKCKTKGKGNTKANLTVLDNKNYIDNYSTYPNPVSERATVAYLSGELQVKDVRVFNAQGIVQNTTIVHDENRKTLEVDMAQFARGVYMNRIKNGDTFSILRVIKQ